MVRSVCPANMSQRPYTKTMWKYTIKVNGHITIIVRVCKDIEGLYAPQNIKEKTMNERFETSEIVIQGITCFCNKDYEMSSQFFSIDKLLPLYYHISNMKHEKTKFTRSRRYACIKLI